MPVYSTILVSDCASFSALALARSGLSILQRWIDWTDLIDLVDSIGLIHLIDSGALIDRIDLIDWVVLVDDAP